MTPRQQRQQTRHQPQPCPEMQQSPWTAPFRAAYDRRAVHDNQARQQAHPPANGHTPTAQANAPRPDPFLSNALTSAYDPNR